MTNIIYVLHVSQVLIYNTPKSTTKRLQVMVEISEKERERRRKAKDADNKIAALSFRLGDKHVHRLRRVSRRRDLAQVSVLRELIDAEYKRVFP
jgi:hypothetical protein